jgi:P-type Cu2+ transporter
MTDRVPADCHLCGLDAGRAPIRQPSPDGPLAFCCHGCANVYAILRESGMVAPGVSLRETDLFKRSVEMGLIGAGGGAEIAADAADVPAGTPTVEKLYRLSGLWCTSCSWLIEHALRKEPGVLSADVLFTSDLLKVRYAPQYLPPSRIIDRLARLGYGAREYTGEAVGTDVENRSLMLRLGIAAFLWMNVMTFNLAIYAGYFEDTPASIRRLLPWVLMALATPAVFYSAWPILRLAWRGLRRGVARMETLLALGILAAYLYSVAESWRGGDHLYFDTACAIVTLMLVGKAIERNARARTSQAVALLYSLVPRKARLLLPTGEKYVAIDALKVGDVFVAKPGERIPADGVVVEGGSHVDASVLTGESTPVRVGAGSGVTCGSVNGDGVLHVRATRVGSDSTLAQIVATVEHALTGRSAIERTVDRVSRWFVPVVLAVALATVAGWLVLRGAATGDALMHGITVLVIACPCALGIATPLALTAAVGTASRKGIFVGDSRAFELLPRADVVVLDKTGTVTEGRFALLSLERVGHFGDATTALAGSIGADDIETLARLAAVERFSEHPLGRAVTDAAARDGVAPAAAVDIQVLKGMGIRGVVDGRTVTIGGSAAMPPIDAATDRRAREWQRTGTTVAFYAWDGKVQGLLAFGDRIREDAARLVSGLARRGIRTLLVSGDSKATTEWVGAAIGAEPHGEVLPDDKAALVASLQRNGLRVVMVGDGINDAPALATADLGIALGSGTDIAMKAAAVVLVRHDLMRVIETIDLGVDALRVVRQNLFWAFLYNSAGITLAVTGILTPIIAAAGMVLSSLSVIGNSYRLTRR